MVRFVEGALHGAGLKFAVIASRFHEAIVDRLLEGAIDCLERHGVSTDTVEVYRVPGAFEIPFVAQELTRRARYDALVTIGVLIRGDTPHFDFICSQVTQGVSRASVESHVPISFGVITCNTIEQAEARTVKGNNKGWEAALAALEMANLYRATRRRSDAATRRKSSPRPRVPASGREVGMGARRKSRELALQMLFQHDLSRNEPAAIITTFEELGRVKPNVRDFAVKLFEGTVSEIESIDSMIQGQADHWRLSRMAVVDRNIIRMSIWEFLHEEETPKLVIIDEAIEIGKKFGTQKSSQFINGILDGILKRYNLQ